MKSSGLYRNKNAAKTGLQVSATCLRSELSDASMLRGVPCHHVMRNHGRIFCSKTGEAADYELSKPIAQIGDFFSHDWVTGRWAKYCVFLIIYNSQAAMVASILVGLALCLLQTDYVGVLPRLAPYPERIAGKTFEVAHGYWCSLVCPVAFFVVLCHWQRLRSALGLQDKIIFVDKLCVDQVNENRKKAAIRGLAAFLRISSRLVVAWSPRYFSRMWCTYELASWHHLGKGSQQVYFVPSSHATFLVLGSIVTSATALFTRFSRVLEDPRKEQVAKLAMVAIQCEIGTLAFLKLARNLSTLPNQLANFTMRETKCFCCSQDHICPVTNLPLPCDRTMVYNTLVKWFAHSKNDDTEDNSIANAERSHDFATEAQALETFDQFIREDFARAILKQTGPTHIAYFDCLLFVCPYLWCGLDSFAGVGSSSLLDLIRVSLVLYGVSPMLIIPCWVKLLMHFIEQTDKMKHTRFGCLRWPLQFSCGGVFGVTLGGASVVVCRYTSSWIVLFAYLALMLVLDIKLFQRKYM